MKVRVLIVESTQHPLLPTFQRKIPHLIIDIKI